MKLYTQEQVNYILDLARKSGVHIAKISIDVDKKLTPFELPSDEEIEKEAKKQYQEQEEAYEDDLEDFFNYANYLELGFMDGMKWMRDKIQGGNNEQ
jgi:hypothetical protein